MAANGESGSHSPNTSSRNDKAFDEAQYTGFLNLSGRKLKEFPHCSNKYDLSDTVSSDLSKNRFGDLPEEICKYESLEQLSCYQNMMKEIPGSLVHLQALVHLNLGRNQLSVLPPFLCSLPALEVLLAANNRLVSLPEEISQLGKLMELDVSCNEITQLPTQIGELPSLRCLNVRRNLLQELPQTVGQLALHKLDFSCNKIKEIPCDLHKMDSLQELRLEHNPLECPPSHLCTKGLVHIKKFLFIQALKENRKRGHMSDVHLQDSGSRKSGHLHHIEDLFINGRGEDAHTLGALDAGYSTTDGGHRRRLAPSEVSLDEFSNDLALRAAVSVKEQRQEREIQRRMKESSAKSHPTNVSPHMEPSQRMPNSHSGQRLVPSSTDLDHSVPVQNMSPNIASPTDLGQPISIQRAARNISTDLGQTIPIQRLPPTMAPSPELGPSLGSPPSVSKPDTSVFPKSSQPSPQEQRPPSNAPSPSSGADEFTRELQRQKSDYEARKRRAEQLRLERERSHEDRHEAGDRKTLVLDRQRQRSLRTSETDSDTMTPSPAADISSPGLPSSHGNPSDMGRVRYIPVIHDKSPTQPQLASQPPAPPASQPPQLSPQADEFRQRFELMLNKRSEEQKQHILRMQKDMVVKWNAPHLPTTSVNEQENISPSQSSTMNMNALPPRCQKMLENMGPELNSMNPMFTMRRNLHQCQEDMDRIENLRKIIETRLKVTLPENLSSALKDGVVLCHLANHIRPRSVSSIHVPSPAVPRLPMAKCRRNVENFLEACRRMGVEEDKLFASMDVLDERGILDVAMTVHFLLDRARDTKHAVV